MVAEREVATVGMATAVLVLVTGFPLASMVTIRRPTMTTVSEMADPAP